MISIQEGLVRTAVLAVLVASIGCGEKTATSPLGRLSVQVLDEKNHGVRSAAADLYRLVDGRPILWRASSTSIDGKAPFGQSDGGVIAGDYLIRVTFISRHRLASSEPKVRRVSLRPGLDTTVTVRAVYVPFGIGP